MSADMVAKNRGAAPGRGRARSRYGCGVRVAQVCPYSVSVPGGVQAQVLGLTRALRRLGHEAVVLAPCDGPPPDDVVVPVGGSVRFAANGSIAPVAPGPGAMRRALAVLAEQAPDVVHVHEPLVPGPAVAVLLRAAPPLVGTFHRAGASGAYRLLGRLLGRAAQARLGALCAVSPEARATAEAVIGPASFTIMPNGVEVERLAGAPPARSAGPTVLFIGRHEPRKGLSVLLQAFPSLPATTHLWIAGEGPQSAELRRRWGGEERIEWLGRISDAEKASRLAGADVYVAPSLHGESFGVVLLEAMAARTPVVASDLPAYGKVARDGVDALLVPPGDADALAAALRRVLEDRALADKLVAAGEARAAGMTMALLAGRYAQLYRDLLRRGA